MDGGVRIGRLRTTLTSPDLSAWLKLEMAVVSLVGKPLVESTYILEGDGPCSLIAYDVVVSQYNFLNDHHHEPDTFPGLSEYLHECVDALLAAGVEGVSFNDVKAKAHLMVTDAWVYYSSVLMTNEPGKSAELADDMKLYLLCKQVNVIAMRLTPSTFATVKPLITRLKYFSEGQILGMEREWSAYMQMCHDLPVEEDDDQWEHKMKRSAEFWRVASVEIKFIAELALYCFTIAPSSASSERVFSVLKSSYSLMQMQSALEDLTETQVMLQYNHRKK